MKTEQEQQAWESNIYGLAEKLLAVLERHTGTRGLDYAVPPTLLHGGFWASLYRFRLAQAPRELSGELVLRILPASDEDGLREAVVQAAVLEAGFPAPRVYLSGGRDAGLGFPFIIMARVAGGTFAAGLAWHEKARLFWRLPSVLAETMAQLHALDATPVREALTRAGCTTRSMGIEAVLADFAARAEPLAFDGFASGLAWLNRHQPAPGRRVICHGDFHPFNVMIAGGEVSGLLDWTHALFAEPAYDVAYTLQLLALWPLDAPLLPRSLLKHLLGRFASWQFMRAYQHRASVDPANLSWYEALHAFRVLLRVARARAGVTLPPLSRKHPWELVAADAADVFHRRTGIRVILPQRSEPREGS